MLKAKPISIENRWDILYESYPEVYDAFVSVPKHPKIIDVLKDHFEFKDKIVLDIGSGSGDSSFQFSPLSKEVVGLEIEDNMRFIAERKLKDLNLNNVSFRKGTALEISLGDEIVDMSIALTLPLFIESEIRTYINEAIRVTKKGGVIINVGIAPFCYGGDLAEVILGESKITEEDTEGVVDRIMRDEYGFSYFDFQSLWNYDSVEHLVSTYGFIFGSKAIDYIQKNNLKEITWTYRVHYLVK